MYFLCGRWLKDGQPVEEGAGHKILLNGQKLLISRAQVSDTGHYKCVAANKAGEHAKEFDVAVHGRLLKGGEKAADCLYFELLVSRCSNFL